MEIRYDKEADALYFKFSSNRFEKNQKVNDFIVLDLDKNNNIIGLEMIDASKKVSIDSIKDVKVISA
jgi:uncharacterized protein YuzE